MTKLVTYNLNGIRSALDKGLLDWIAANDFDIICFQETKAQPDQVDMSGFEALGYHCFWHSAVKKGYSGVLTLTKKAPDLVQIGMGMETYDNEGRVIRTDFGDVTLLNCYFPSGSSGEERQGVKMEFLADFKVFADELRKTRPKLIVVGDYNIAHTEQDIHDPKGNKNSSGFLPEEREWMTQWLAGGMVDAFRTARPTEKTYSWWSFRFQSRSKNKGWRIDYQTISELLAASLKDAYQINDAVHSDHCPVWAEYDF
jgi:exodeoxyribonuclease III